MPTARSAAQTILVLVSLAAAACREPLAPLPSSVVDVAVDTSAGPLVRAVTVRLERAAPVEVTYGAARTPVLTITADSAAMVHRLVLPRLRAAREYTMETRVPDTGEDVVSQTFETGALPPEIAAIQLHVTGTASLPVALIEVARGSDFAGLLMVEKGEVVGYIPVGGALFGMTRRASGDFVLLHQEEGLLVKRLDGTLLYRLPQTDTGTPYGRIHHDVTATPANTLLFIADETRLVDGETVVGEALWEWTPETDAIVQRWSAFEHLDWATDRGSRSVAGNWLHGNGISFGARGNVLMSLRNADRIISIAPDFSRLEWTLGGDNGSLALSDTDRFYGQHYVTEPAPGRVLLFDNGWERPGGAFSRAIEYAVDAAAGTATAVWEYRPSPDIYSSLVGSAVRLPNGNTTVLFGMLGGQNGSTGPLSALEVTPAGATVWRLTVGSQLTRLYRLTPVATLLGEQPGAFNRR